MMKLIKNEGVKGTKGMEKMKGNKVGNKKKWRESKKKED